MKSPGSLGWKVLLALVLGLGGASARVLAADLEFDLSDDAKPTPTVAPKNNVVVKPMPSPTAVIVLKPTAVTSQATPVPTPLAKGKVTPEIMEVPTSTPTEVVVAEETPIVIQGKLKMKDIYAAGIRAYQEQDYDTAIQYLQKALGMEDVYSQKFYYAEAAAMLGVIYQFHVIHNDKALHYYELALKYEKKNSTARRHIREVQKLLKEGE